MFLDAFVLPSVQLYSMQKGPPAAELKAEPNAPIIDLAPALDDFADAAALVAEMDLIIMTDSAVAHLAGAMGKPVSLLLNHAPYWMLSAQGKDKSWYDFIEVIKQSEPGSWTKTFDIISGLLCSGTFRIDKEARRA